MNFEEQENSNDNSSVLSGSVSGGDDNGSRADAVDEGGIDFLALLPPELSLLVLSYVPLVSVPSVASCCSLYNSLMSDPVMYMKAVDVEFYSLARSAVALGGFAGNPFCTLDGDSGDDECSSSSSIEAKEREDASSQWKSFYAFLTCVTRVFPQFVSENQKGILDVAIQHDDISFIAFCVQFFPPSDARFAIIAEKAIDYDRFDVVELMLSSDVFLGFPLLSRISSVYGSKLSSSVEVYLDDKSPSPVRIPAETTHVDLIFSSKSKSLFTFRNCCSLQRLKTLHAQGMGFEKIPDEIGSCADLNELAVCSMALFHVPEAICNLSSLRKLDLSHCRMIALPKNFDLLHDLRSLFLAYSCVESLPPTFCCLRRLEKLILTRSKVTELPDCIGELKMLTEVSLRSTSISTLPDSFYRLHNLRVLHLGRTKMSSFPAEFSQLRMLEDLSIRSANFERFPECICECANLKSLDISGNYIASLPTEIVLLTRLEEFIASDIHLLSLPLGFCTFLKNLRRLDLATNSLTTLPGDFGALSQLEWVYLSGNSIASLPDSIGRLRYLKYFHINHNMGILRIPNSFTNLMGLEILSFVHCAVDCSNLVKSFLTIRTHAQNLLPTFVGN